MSVLAWGAKVSPQFRSNVLAISGRLVVDASDMMACMAFESGETFSPSIRNAAGSGAVGLIQFMPSTCASMGLTVDQMAALTAEQQLTFVERYFRPWSGRMHTLGDIYGAILWPGMIGKPDSAVIFDQADPNHPKLYVQNKGLDFNKDGKITKAEIVARVQKERDRGLQPANAFTL